MLSTFIRNIVIKTLDVYYKLLLSSYRVVKYSEGFVLIDKDYTKVIAVTEDFTVIHDKCRLKFITYTKLFNRIVDDRWDGDRFTVQDIAFNPYGRLQAFLKTHYNDVVCVKEHYDDLFRLGRVAVTTPFDRSPPWDKTIPLIYPKEGVCLK